MKNLNYLSFYKQVHYTFNSDSDSILKEIQINSFVKLYFDSVSIQDINFFMFLIYWKLFYLESLIGRKMFLKGVKFSSLFLKNKKNSSDNFILNFSNTFRNLKDFDQLFFCLQVFKIKKNLSLKLVRYNNFVILIFNSTLLNYLNLFDPIKSSFISFPDIFTFYFSFKSTHLAEFFIKNLYDFYDTNYKKNSLF